LPKKWKKGGEAVIDRPSAIDREKEAGRVTRLWSIKKKKQEG